MRQPPGGTYRLYLISRPTVESKDQPAFFGQCAAGITLYRGHLLLGGHTNRSGKADPACNIAVGSCCLLTFFTRPSERPGRATATAAIRSKPIAPGGIHHHRQLIG